MSEAVQLDMFHDISPSSVEELRTDIGAQRIQLGNLRRGIFARHNALRSLVLDLQSRIRRIEMELNIPFDEVEELFELEAAERVRKAPGQSQS